MITSVNRRYKAVATLLLGAAIFWLAGCTTGSHLERSFINNSPPPQRDMSVLVVPFQNLTVHPNAGTAVAKLIATELYKDGIFTVQESPLLDTVQSAGNHLAEEPVAMARAAGADVVLTGSVTEYGYRYGFRKQPVVGITIRLIRTDGTILWAASASEVGSAYLGKDSVTEAAQRVVMRLVQGLSQLMMEDKQ
ncbi:MAG TPA: hypothetical protein ENK38_00815 [Gammaproteobacteria bacterium]|nr:hypothetical protein [Gammaproteobacteria bacterium]